MQLITEECVHKLDTKHQTNALLNLVWRDSASEEVFTMMASICHTLMVQHRLMVPKVRYWDMDFFSGCADALWLKENYDRSLVVNGNMCKFENVKTSVKRRFLISSCKFYMYFSFLHHVVTFDRILSGWAPFSTGACLHAHLIKRRVSSSCVFPRCKQ